MFSTFLVILAVFFLTPLNAFAKTIEHVYAFGDSLTDNGNMYVTTAGNIPPLPYFYGRFTNGITWIEMLLLRVGLTPSDLTNYAIGGAQTHSSVPPGLELQVDKFLEEHATIKPTDLFSIWSGANDYIYDAVVDLAKIQHSVDIIGDVITRLSSHGAQVFLVPNIPDISTTPWAYSRDAANGDHVLSMSIARSVKEHNRRLTRKLKTLEHRLRITIVHLDVFSRIRDAVQHPARYHLKNVKEACYDPERPLGAQVCDDPRAYLFWDYIHPTQQMHEEVAREATVALQQKGYNDNYKVLEAAQ